LSVGSAIAHPNRRTLGKAFGSLAMGALLAVVGVGASAGSLPALVTGGAACLFLMVSLVVFWLERHQPGYMTVEVPVFLLLLVTLGLRARDASDLADNPLDPVGQFRLACTLAALFLGLIALTSRTLDPSLKEENISSRPTRLYASYVVTVFAGMLTSVFPPLTGYRAVQVLTALVVLAGAYRTAGASALSRIERLLYWWAAFRITTVWINVFVPGGALQHIDAPFPYRLQGVAPLVSYDTVGTMGVLLALWSTCRLLTPAEERGPRRSVTIAIGLYGFVTLVAAQYRTGYVAFVVGLALLILLRGRKALAGIIVVGTIAAAAWGPSLAEEANPYFLRGQPEERVQGLSNRTNWWALAIPVWKESPIIGGGLRTSSRLVVLAGAGYDQTGTIHSTWVEALVGTGVVGVTLLAAALLVALRRSMTEATRMGGRIVPLVLLTIVAVRSLTGTAIEDAGYSQLLFLTLAFGLRDAPAHLAGALSAIQTSGAPARGSAGKRRRVRKVPRTTVFR
jgi:O-antigen ligase